MFEVLSTRSSKVAFGYDFQFIILSLAILGIGIGGMFVYFRFNNLSSEKVPQILTYTAIVYAVLIVLPFLLIPLKNSYGESIAKGSFFLFSFMFYFAGGAYISMVFRYYPERISRLYFFTMLGSGIGSVGVLLLLKVIGTEKTVAAIFLIAASLVVINIASRSSGKKTLATALVLIIAAILIFSFLPERVKIMCETEPDIGSLIVSESNSFSQLDTYEIGPIRVLNKGDSGVFD
jgi:hypothetical protein